MELLLSKSLLASFMLLASSAHARSGCDVTPFEKNCGLIHKIVEVTTEHKRKTAEEYADGRDVNLVNKIFEATGQLKCSDGTSSTAQLTGKDNVITFAGHTFCPRASAPQNCKFVLGDSAGARSIEVDLSDDSLATGPCGSIGGTRDWGTAKLKSPMTGVKHYDIPCEQNPPLFTPNKRVLLVASPHVGWAGKGKSYEDCFVKDVNYSDNPAIKFGQNQVGDRLQHDCNTGYGASGAAMFVKDTAGRFVIGAINTSQHAIAKDTKPGSGYDKDKLFNTAVQLRGDFLKAIRKNMGQKDNEPQTCGAR